MNASNPLDTLIEQSRKARDHAGRNLADDRGHIDFAGFIQSFKVTDAVTDAVADSTSLRDD